MTDIVDRLANLSVPGPTRTALTGRFWDAAAGGRFEIQQCQDCGQHIFYPRDICPSCWSPHLRWVEASGKGTLRSFTVVHRPGHPGWAQVTPYVVGIVALAEGPTMLSHILVAPEDAVVGMKLAVRMTKVGPETLPCFEPDN